MAFDRTAWPSFNYIRSIVSTPSFTRLAVFAGFLLILLFVTLGGLHPHAASILPSRFSSSFGNNDNQREEKLGYVTFLSSNVAAEDDSNDFKSDVYFTGVRLLGWQFMHNPTTRTRRNIPFIVLVAPSVPPLKRERLQRDGAIVIPATPVDTGEWQTKVSRWADVMMKLRLWELTDYSRLLFLDADSLLYRPLDSVFDDPAAMVVDSSTGPKSPLQGDEGPIPDRYLFSSVSEVNGEHSFPPTEESFRRGRDYFNAGFMMFAPTPTLFAHYQSMWPANGTTSKFNTRFPEQNLLNYAHRKEGPMPWQNLDSKYNLLGVTKNDLEKGLYSSHDKWWTPASKDLMVDFDRDIARMEGFYMAWDKLSKS